MSDLTQILHAIDQGDHSAADQLLPIVYEELRVLARRRLAQEQPDLSVNATMLVHEAYLRLVAGEQEQHWNGRRHFFGAAAEAMRRILIDRARRKRSQKHGGQMRRADIDMEAATAQQIEPDLLALDEALSELEQCWPEKAVLVKLRYFAGMSIPEASEALGISTATAERYWRFARAWLHSQLQSGD